MAELNRSAIPAKVDQQSTNKRVSHYALMAIDSDIGGNYVGRVVSSAWALPTGTAERTTFATYTAPTISALPTQAEVQALANEVQSLSRHLKALIDDLGAGGTI